MTTEKANQAKTYHHGDLKNALINAGLEILSAEGITALSLRKVARKVGVSHTAPYNHFENKEALVVGIAAEGFSRLTQSMESSLPLFPDDPRKQLLEIGWGYVRFALENPDYFRVMFSELGGDVMALDSEREHTNSFGILLNTIRACQAAGDVAAGDPIQLAFSAWSVVHGTAMLLINTPFPPDIERSIPPEQIARANIERLFGGLRVG